MDSTEFVNVVARVCIRAWEIREQSYDRSRNRYQVPVCNAVTKALDESGLAGPERELAAMCASGAFQGEFVDWAEKMVKGK